MIIMRSLAIVTAFFLNLGLNAADARSKSAMKPCVLQVHTYESFVSKWGPGEALKLSFEKNNNCQVQWIISSSAMSLYSRLLLDGPKGDGDVVVGLDSFLLAEVKKHNLMENYTPKEKNNLKKSAVFSQDFYLIPYSIGYFALMYDTTNIKPYDSWEALLADPAANKKLLIQDPRTSSVGFGLLAWFSEAFPKNYAEKIKQLQPKVLTISKGWSESYGLFLKGEAPMVLSYTLSEAYHSEESKGKSPYRYMEFKEGHLAQIGAMGVLKNSKNKGMARSFIDHMLSNESQKTIAALEKVYPVLEKVDLPESVAKVKIPDRILTVSSSRLSPDFRSQWTRQWIDLVTTK